MYEDILDRGIKRTIISFDPFLKRDDVKGLTDAQVGRRVGLEASTVKAMRLHQDVPFDTIQKICHALGCQPGDVLNATEVWTIPPTKKTRTIDARAPVERLTSCYVSAHLCGSLSAARCSAPAQ